MAWFQACADAWGTVWHGGIQPTDKSVWFSLSDAPVLKTT